MSVKPRVACKYCDFKIKRGTYQELLEHIDECHKDVKVCTVMGCRFQCKSILDLQTHVKSRHVYHCTNPDCGRICDSPHGLKYHVTTVCKPTQCMVQDCIFLAYGQDTYCSLHRNALCVRDKEKKDIILTVCNTRNCMNTVKKTTPQRKCQSCLKREFPNDVTVVDDTMEDHVSTDSDIEPHDGTKKARYDAIDEALGVTLVDEDNSSVDTMSEKSLMSPRKGISDQDIFIEKDSNSIPENDSRKSMENITESNPIKLVFGKDKMCFSFFPDDKILPTEKYYFDDGQAYKVTSLESTLCPPAPSLNGTCGELQIQSRNGLYDDAENVMNMCDTHMCMHVVPSKCVTESTMGLDKLDLADRLTLPPILDLCDIIS